MRSRHLRSTELGPKTTEGTRLMWAALKAKDWSQNRLARELANAAGRTLDSGTVNRWLHGLSAPTLQWALVIGRVLGISPEAFVRAPRRRIELRTGTEG